MVGAMVDLDAVVEQPLRRRGPARARSGYRKHVVETGVARRWWRTTGALPRVDRDVVVVVAGREERGFEAGPARRPSRRTRARRGRTPASGRGRRPEGGRGRRGPLGGGARSPCRQSSGRRGPRHRWIHLTEPARDNRCVDDAAACAGRPRAGARGHRRRARRAGGGRGRRRGDRGRAGHRQVAAARPPRGERRRGLPPCFGRTASEFEADLPYALLRGASATGGMPRRPGRSPRGARGLRDRLRAIAGAAPLVLCLDDVHWADPARSTRSRRCCGARAGGAGAARRRRARRPAPGLVAAALAGVREGRSPPLAAGTARPRPRRASSSATSRTHLRRRRRQPVLPGAAGAGRADPGGRRGYRRRLGAARRDRRADRRAGGAHSRPRAGSSTRPPSRAIRSSRTRGRRGRAARGGGAGRPRRARSRTTSPAAARHGASCSATRRAARGLRATPSGWRIGAHARAAAALARLGAGPVQPAHHVEQAAGPGDEEAIAVLDAAAAELQSLAPGTAGPCWPPCSACPEPGPRGARGRLAAGRRPGGRGRCGRLARRRCSPRCARRSRPSTSPHRGLANRSGGSGAPRTLGGGCRSHSARSPRSRRRIASGCGWRSP